MSNGEEKPHKRTIDERIDALTMNLELFSRDVEHFRADVQSFRVEVQALGGAVESLRESTANLAITSKQDGENIRALARIAEIHERRLSAIEGNATPAA